MHIGFGDDEAERNRRVGGRMVGGSMAANGLPNSRERICATSRRQVRPWQ